MIVNGTIVRRSDSSTRSEASIKRTISATLYLCVTVPALVRKDPYRMQGTLTFDDTSSHAIQHNKMIVAGRSHCGVTQETT